LAALFSFSTLLTFIGFSSYVCAENPANNIVSKESNL